MNLSIPSMASISIFCLWVAGILNFYEAQVGLVTAIIVAFSEVAFMFYKRKRRNKQEQQIAYIKALKKAPFDSLVSTGVVFSATETAKILVLDIASNQKKIDIEFYDKDERIRTETFFKVK